MAGQRGVASIGKWRRNTFVTLALAALASRWLLARVLAAVCVGVIPLLSWLEGQFRFADYKHYKNN